MLLELARLFFYLTLGQLFQGLFEPWGQQQWLRSLLLLRLAVLSTFSAWTIGFLTGDTSMAYTYAHLQHIESISGSLGILWAGAAGANLLFWFFMGESTRLALSLLPALSKPLSLKIQRLIIPQLLFMAFVILWHSNPFEHYWPFPPQSGLELNPLLQHQALSYHPPLLLLGTASLFGLVILESFEKITNQSLPSQIRRRWLLGSLGILGLGITAGSHWAYHVLGWGGWWFWDPIETISLINWTGALALLHHRSKSAAFQSWNALSLWATIVTGLVLVRGGGLVSVHSFVHESPSLLLLSFLSWSILSALWPLFLKSHSSKSSKATGLIATTFVMLSGLLIPVALVLLGAESSHLSASYYEGTVGVCLLFFLVLEIFSAPFALLYLGTTALLPFNLTLAWASLLLIKELSQQRFGTRLIAHSLMLMGLGLMSIASSFDAQQYIILSPEQSVTALGAEVKLLASHLKVEKAVEKWQHQIVIQYRGENLRCLVEKISHPFSKQQLTPISYVTTWRGEDFGFSVLPDQSGFRIFYRPFVRWIWGLMTLLSVSFLLRSLLWDIKFKELFQCTIQPFFSPFFLSQASAPK